VNEKMEVLDKAGKVVPNVYCIGDANGKYMLAHAASAQVRGAALGACGDAGGRQKQSRLMVQLLMGACANCDDAICCMDQDVLGVFFHLCLRLFLFHTLRRPLVVKSLSVNNLPHVPLPRTPTWHCLPYAPQLSCLLLLPLSLPLLLFPLRL
jgi:hypothetical protein